VSAVYILRCDGEGCTATALTTHGRAHMARAEAAKASEWTSRPVPQSDRTLDFCGECSRSVRAHRDMKPSNIRSTCATCGAAGHNSRTCPVIGKATAPSDDDAAPPFIPSASHRRPSLYELRKLEARRIVDDEKNPINPRGTMPTPLSTWVF
jgi:hypothetical protein